MKKNLFPAYIFMHLLFANSPSQTGSLELVSGEPEANISEFHQQVPWEEIYLHTDREKYISGEEVWFSIYTFGMETGRLSERSVIAYVELLNPWNVPVIQSRIRLSGGRGAGNFSIPDSVSSGTYTIRAYTNWMKNFLPDNCFTGEIDVYNPFSNSGFLWKNSTTELKLKENGNQAERINSLSISSDSIFGRREKVILKIGANNINGAPNPVYDLSISVANEIATGRIAGLKGSMLNAKEGKMHILSGANGPLKYGFENTGHILSVTIKYRDKNITDSSDYVYMSVRGKVAEFDYAAKDNSGRFNFVLPADTRLRNLILQPEDANRNMILEIEPSFSRILPENPSVRHKNNDSIQALFSELSFNYQASRIYAISPKNKSGPDSANNLKKRRFYGIPEMEIFLDDYIKLPSMQEVFYELLPGINFRSAKSGYQILIINPLTGVFYYEPPLVMIDGVIINDLTVLAELNPELVEKIEVVKSPYLIGDLILHGIVNVITRSGDFSDITMPEYAAILPFRVVDGPDIFAAPDYSDENKRTARIPDLRNTLYWNPSVNTDSNGAAEIEFWTSDQPGNYTINVQGVSQTGEMVSLYRSITVR